MMYLSNDLTDKTNGRWTKLQHQNFLLGLQMYGKNWKKIEQLIGTRNGSQIRSHAQKFFLKFKKTQSNDFSQLDSADADVELTPKDSQIFNISKSEEENSAKISDYSYFLGKIVQYSSQKQEEFDFWSSLIDTSCTSQTNSEKQNKRKNSYNSLSESLQNEEFDRMILPTKKLKII